MPTMHRRACHWSLAVALAAAATLSSAQGIPTMSSTSRSTPLLWQGAADRKTQQFIALRVTDVRKEGGGLFGIGNSPSIAGAMPDARLVEGQTLNDPGAVVRLKAPGGELPAGLGKGSRLVLGLVDPRHVICLLSPPESVADDALLTWAAGQPCG
jgi:hypothetical protein